MPSEKAVLQYSFDGVFVKRHISQSEAARALDMHCSAISGVLIGRAKTAGGYQWMYHREGEPIPQNIEPVVGSHRRTPVLQYDTNGVFVRRYKSEAEASRRTGIAASGISEVLNSKRKTAGGYQWRRHSENESIPTKINPVA